MSLPIVDKRIVDDEKWSVGVAPLAFLLPAYMFGWLPVFGGFVAFVFGGLGILLLLILMGRRPIGCATSFFTKVTVVLAVALPVYWFVWSEIWWQRLQAFFQ